MLTDEQIDKLACSDLYTFARAVEAFVLNPPKEWITHVPGDPCPVDGGVEVYVKFRDGSELSSGAFPASWHFWGRAIFSTDDIIAYRVK